MALAELNGAAEEVTLLGGQPGGTGETLLRSPINGRVEESTLTLGEHVDTEQVCFTVINLEKVWVELAVAPKDISKLEMGDEVEVRADSAPPYACSLSSNFRIGADDVVVHTSG